MSPSFAFQPANPFSTERVAPKSVQFRFSAGESGTEKRVVISHLDGLVAKVQSSRRNFIVGPHGTGKSTLLFTLLPKLQQAFPKVAFHQLNNDPSMGFFGRMRERSSAGKRIRKELTLLPEEGLLIVDGWEQLGRLAKWRISNSAFVGNITLLVTVHERLSGWNGIYETRISSAMVSSLAKDLLRDAPYGLKKLVQDNLKSRKLHARTNVRHLWFEFYDLVQDYHEQQKRAKADAFR